MLTSEEILARVKLMRSRIEGCEGYVCDFDEMFIDSFNYFIIWDDANLLTYAISANPLLENQGMWPFRIKVFTYAKLERIDTLHSGSPVPQYKNEGGNAL